MNKMITKLAICLLGFAGLTACGTTHHATQNAPRKRVEEIARARNEKLIAGTYQAPAAVAPDWTNEDIPAAGPDGEDEDIPGEGPRDIDRNPALVPSPLLRTWASSATP